MPKKEVVSFAIDIDTLDEINDSIQVAKNAGFEMDFSKWMRDAVRRKLKMRRRVSERRGTYSKKK
jgi:hypothetical protein